MLLTGENQQKALLLVFCVVIWMRMSLGSSSPIQNRTLICDAQRLRSCSWVKPETTCAKDLCYRKILVNYTEHEMQCKNRRTTTVTLQSSAENFNLSRYMHACKHETNWSRSLRDDTPAHSLFWLCVYGGRFQGRSLLESVPTLPKPTSKHRRRYLAVERHCNNRTNITLQKSIETTSI